MPNRRDFLRAAGALSVPLILPRLCLSDPPSDRLSHACIGADGMGWGDMQSLSSHEKIEIVAICDVDTSRMAKAAERFPQARQYQDWRELLDTEADRIDSVNVTVPDHMHAPISMAAIMAVPLSRTRAAVRCRASCRIREPQAGGGAGHSDSSVAANILSSGVLKSVIVCHR